MIHVPGPKFGPLSFADAKVGGEAMYDRWVAMNPPQPGWNFSDNCHPPFERDDAAWADLFRSGFDALRWGK